MDKEAFKIWLISLFPEFGLIWESEDNIYREGEEYTFHGLCSEFSHYFQEKSKSFDDSKMKILFTFIEEWVKKDSLDKLGLSNALYTCFLENIAQTDSGKESKKYMGLATCKFFEQWDS